MAGEFKGDFSRDSFDFPKHFSRVLFQQGRVFLDADWNEQAAILLRLLRVLGADLTKGFGSFDYGFFLDQSTSSMSTQPMIDFIIVPGHCYLDGILCSCDGSPVPFSTSDNPNSISNVLVSAWMPDDLAFQQGQYVALLNSQNSFDPSPGKGFPQKAQITAADPSKRALTLSPAATGFQATDSPNFFLRRLTTFLTQPDYPLPPDQLSILQTLAKNNPGGCLVYLDVWERHIAAFQDPSIREIALEGIDTASRAKIVAQVKIDPDFNLSILGGTPSQPNIAAARKVLADLHQPYNRGWMQARLKPPSDASPLDPCMTHPDARYRGAENQLYRVEIHTPSIAPAGVSESATFKWSRENACVTFPILSSNGSIVFLETLGRDSRFGLKIDDWVEVLDDILILQGQQGTLFQIASISLPDRSVTLKSPISGVTPPTVVKDDPAHPHAFLRRWDHQDSSGKGITIVEPSANNPSVWYDLEDGIQVQFQPALSPSNTASSPTTSPQNVYRTGDYWLIPARTSANGIIDWPTVLDSSNTPVAVALPPHGVNHHYAPLGVIQVSLTGALTIKQQLVPSLEK